MILHGAGLRGEPEKRKSNAKNKKEQGIGDVVSNLGFAFELLKVIAHAVMAKGGSMQHLRRIVKEPALQQQIADLVVPAGSEVERPLGARTKYRVPVTLRHAARQGNSSEFSKDGVSELFYGNYVWQPHSSCAEIDQTPGERIMLVKHFGRERRAKANIVEMDNWATAPRPPRGVRVRQGQPRAAAPVLDRRPRLVRDGRWRPFRRDAGRRFRQAHLRRRLVRRRVGLRPPVPVRPQVDLGPSVTRPFRPEARSACG